MARSLSIDHSIETRIILTHVGDAHPTFCATRIAMDEAEPQAKSCRAIKASYEVNLRTETVGRLANRS